MAEAQNNSSQESFAVPGHVVIISSDEEMMSVGGLDFGPIGSPESTSCDAVAVVYDEIIAAVLDVCPDADIDTIMNIIDNVCGTCKSQTEISERVCDVFLQNTNGNIGNVTAPRTLLRPRRKTASCNKSAAKVHIGTASVALSAVSQGDQNTDVDLYATSTSRLHDPTCVQESVDGFRGLDKSDIHLNLEALPLTFPSSVKKHHTQFQLQAPQNTNPAGNPPDNCNFTTNGDKSERPNDDLVFTAGNVASAVTVDNREVSSSVGGEMKLSESTIPSTTDLKTCKTIKVNVKKHVRRQRKTAHEPPSSSMPIFNGLSAQELSKDTKAFCFTLSFLNGIQNVSAAGVPVDWNSKASTVTCSSTITKSSMQAAFPESSVYNSRAQMLTQDNDLDPFVSSGVGTVESASIKTTDNASCKSRTDDSNCTVVFANRPAEATIVSTDLDESSNMFTPKLQERLSKVNAETESSVNTKNPTRTNASRTRKATFKSKTFETVDRKAPQTSKRSASKALTSRAHARIGTKMNDRRKLRLQRVIQQASVTLNGIHNERNENRPNENTARPAFNQDNVLENTSINVDCSSGTNARKADNLKRPSPSDAQTANCSPQKQISWKSPNGEMDCPHIFGLKEETTLNDGPSITSVFEDQNNNSLYECQCCYDEVSFEDLVQCSEGHLFCSECLRKYTQESVYGGGRATLLCIVSDGCTAAFPLSQLRRALPADLFEKYEERVEEEFISMAHLEDFIRCKYCNVGAELEKGQNVFNCPNEKCKKSFCRLCKNDWEDHVGLQCNQVEKKDETKLRLEFEEKMAQAKIRQCTKCSAKFTKEDGCNKITCRCGVTMCYICRKQKISYDHFCQHRVPKNGTKKCRECSHSCPLWSKGEEDDDLAIRELKNDAYAARLFQGFEEIRDIGAPTEVTSQNTQQPKDAARMRHPAGNRIHIPNPLEMGRPGRGRARGRVLLMEDRYVPIYPNPRGCGIRRMNSREQTPFLIAQAAVNLVQMGQGPMGQHADNRAQMIPHAPNLAQMILRAPNPVQTGCGQIGQPVPNPFQMGHGRMGQWAENLAQMIPHAPNLAQMILHAPNPVQTGRGQIGQPVPNPFQMGHGQMGQWAENLAQTIPHAPNLGPVGHEQVPYQTRQHEVGAHTNAQMGQAQLNMHAPQPAFMGREQIAHQVRQRARNHAQLEPRGPIPVRMGLEWATWYTHR